jgi:hypothetical protein
MYIWILLGTIFPILRIYYFDVILRTVELVLTSLAPHVLLFGVAHTHSNKIIYTHVSYKTHSMGDQKESHAIW